MRIIVMGLLLAGMLLAGGCKSGGDDSAKGGADEAASERTFDKDMRKKGCEILSAELVADTFGVAEGELEQLKVAGCVYSWEGESEELQAQIMMISAHKSVESATSWFANATADRTAEEMAESMKKLKGDVEKREELDTDLKKGTAGALMGMIPTEAVSFEDVDAGDEARVNNDGNVYVRVGNLTFSISAYKGAKQPELEMPEKPTQESIMTAAKKHAADWADATRAQRKKDGATLAKAVADAL